MHAEVCACVCVLIYYTLSTKIRLRNVCVHCWDTQLGQDDDTGNKHWPIQPHFAASVAQIVMTAGKMTTSHPLQPTCNMRYLSDLFKCASGRTGVVVVAGGDFEDGGGQGGVGDAGGGWMGGVVWGLAALLPPVNPLSQPGGQAVLGSPAPR